MTIVARMAFGSPTNISSEEDCNLRA